MRPPCLPDLASQTRKSPEHSGGAVPDSHRSSLFAGRPQLRTPGHQSRRPSVAVAVTLSTRPAAPGPGRKLRHAAAPAWQSLPVGASVPSRRAGR